ncbi:MAG: Gluconate 2-dehydrogenase subunit 3, partial [Bacteroidota bacterium]
MKRRTMLGAIVFYSVLGNTLVSCKDKYKAIKELKLKNIKLDNDDLDIIEDISKLIFPTDKIEAFKNHTSLPYTLTVLDDCASPHKQKAFIEGIKTFQQAVQKKFNTSFVDLSPEDKMKFLQETNQSK